MKKNKNCINQSGTCVSTNESKFQMFLFSIHKDLFGVQLIDVYIFVAITIATINFLKSIPACISPGKGKNGSTVAVSAEM